MIRLSLPATAVVLAAACTVTYAFDEIYVAGLPPQRGTIVEMSPTKVTIDIERRRKTFQVNEIKSIAFDLEPLELKAARGPVTSGQFEMALKKLDVIKEADVGRDIVLQDVKFYKAYCAARLALAGSGEKKAAGAALDSFITEHPGNYHYFQAVETFGNLAVSVGSFEKAAESYAELAKAPWPDYRLRATVAEGRALMAKGGKDDYRAAYAKFQTVLDASGDIPGAQKQKNFATLGRAACLAATPKYAEGIKLVEKIIDKGDPEDITLFARAYNTLGTCYLKSDRPKDALLAYLHVDILFYGDPESHAEALFHLCDLWEKVGHPERAVKSRNLLRQRYPGSVWVGKLD